MKNIFKSNNINNSQEINLNKKNIISEIEKWKNSDAFNNMTIGENYYNVLNKITNHQRTIVGKNGRPVNAQNVANTKLAHAFLRELVDQKIQYLLGKNWTITQNIDSTNSDFLAQTKTILDDKFFNVIVEATRNSIIGGVGWIHVYYDENSKLNFCSVNPKDIIPIWKENSKDVLKAVIHTVQDQNSNQIIEYWNNNGVFRFNKINNKLVEQKLKSVNAHFTCDNKPFAWNKLPFVQIKYNANSQPLISFIKSLIDDYDLTSSNLSNALQDQPNSILVIKNYDGQKLDEFRNNLAVFRAVKVSGDGGVEALNTPVCHDATTAHLETLRRDIYAFGRGVDTRNEHSLAAVGSIALKHVYARLDLDCNGIEGFIKQAINQIMFFVSAHINNTSNTQNINSNIQVIFNRDIIISEESAIDMCVNSKNIISDLTILENHPWVRDAEDEKIRLETQNNKNI